MILVVSGLILSEINFHGAEQDFDERLAVYVRALVADVAVSSDDAHSGNPPGGTDVRTAARRGGIGRSPGSDTATPEIRASRSLFADRLPQLAQAGVAAFARRRAQGATSPGRTVGACVWWSASSMPATTGATSSRSRPRPEEMTYDIDGFNLSLGLTFLLLGIALVGSTALQLRFGLRPLRRMREGARRDPAR